MEKMFKLPIKQIKDAYLFTSGLYFDEPQIRKGLELLKKNQDIIDLVVIVICMGC